MASRLGQKLVCRRGFIITSTQVPTDHRDEDPRNSTDGELHTIKAGLTVRVAARSGFSIGWCRRGKSTNRLFPEPARNYNRRFTIRCRSHSSSRRWNDIGVVYEDQWFICVNKASGMLSQRDKNGHNGLLEIHSENILI